MSAARKFEEQNVEVVSQLRSCSLFLDAPDEATLFAERHVEEIFAKRGECIILENDTHDSIYFVIKGAVEIVSYLSAENRIQRLGLLKAGSNFAEFSILTKTARSGSAYAFEDCTLYRMPGAAFMEMLMRFPAIALHLAKLYAGINQSVEGVKELIPFYDPSQLMVTSEVANLFPIAVWSRFGVIPVSIHAGSLTVIVKNPHNIEFFNYVRQTLPQAEIILHAISEVEFEAALQTAKHNLKSPRLVRKMAARNDNRNENENAISVDVPSALRNSNQFSMLPDKLIEQIVTRVVPIAFEMGQSLLAPEGDVSAYYLVAKGCLKVQQPIHQAGLKNTWTSLMSLDPGDGVGDVQLLAGGKYPYRVIAAVDSVVIPIPAAIVQQLLQVPSFAVALASNLAKRLQVLGHVAGLGFLKSKGKIDFKPVAHLLPLSLMTEFKVIPLRISDSEVTLCAVNPDTANLLSRIGRYFKGCRLQLYSVQSEQFQVWLAQLTAQLELGDEKLSQTAKTKQHPKVDVMKWVDQVIVTGMKNRASDIHFEPSESHLHVRYRIDGVLQESNERVDIEAGREVLNRLKIISDMDIAIKALPQDGQMKTNIEDVEVIARASTIPVRQGEKFVLRLIRSQSSVVPLAMISPDRRIINILNSVTRSRQGLFLVTGPTGSGKTTTLYSLLNAINDVGVNVTTLEDPVEMEIEGFNQIEVDQKRGLTFGSALRAVLRQDPNVIMVGEIRDSESAKIVFDASITGHLVLSTLHTTSSLDIGPRLLELGVSNANIASGLLGVLTQRLVRANCKKCLTKRVATRSEQNVFAEFLGAASIPVELAHSVGCPACGNSGYFHRVPVLEVWQNSLAMQRALLEKRSPEEMKVIARAEGFQTLLESALKFVLSGVTSLEEVRRVLGGF